MFKNIKHEKVVQLHEFHQAFGGNMEWNIKYCLDVFCETKAHTLKFIDLSNKTNTSANKSISFKLLSFVFAFILIFKTSKWFLRHHAVIWNTV